MLIKPPPLSLYIHLPWCIRKCPYCDFNSYQADGTLPEAAYVEALIQDLDQTLEKAWGRRLISIFMGGGTPSLFSPSSIEKLLQAVQSRFDYDPFIEITLEANPGTFEQAKFSDFRQAGINRLSIGIQSFQAEKLKALGRVHTDDEAKRAITIAQNAGFENINLDLMHGLPHQSVSDALFDLKTALSFNPTHLSWYQLTMEPNTLFAKFPPKLPEENELSVIQSEGHELITAHDYLHYEISAYAKKGCKSVHNLNYWQFGDYLGIGAGAHGKITDINTQTITRIAKTRNPKDYLDASKPFTANEHIIPRQELPLEFMMNALRLNDGLPNYFFTERTGLSLAVIHASLEKAHDQQLLDKESLKASELGKQYLNDLLLLFNSDFIKNTASL